MTDLRHIYRCTDTHDGVRCMRVEHDIGPHQAPTLKPGALIEWDSGNPDTSTSQPNPQSSTTATEPEKPSTAGMPAGSQQD